jgi:hypothetical protein
MPLKHRLPCAWGFEGEHSRSTRAGHGEINARDRTNFLSREQGLKLKSSRSFSRVRAHLEIS